MKFEEANLKNDIESILNIGKHSFTKFYSKEKIIKKLEGKKYWVYVAKEGNKIIGFKIWYELNPNKIYSWLGAVHPDYRKRGIATKLMKIQFKIAKELGYDVIEIKTHIGHPEMLKMLEKEKFKEIKREPNHWGNGKEAIFFEKDLAKTLINQNKLKFSPASSTR